jgi:ankyrin repeat protein
MGVTVKHFNNKKVGNYFVNDDATVLDVKKLISDDLGIGADSINLIVAGASLNDGASVKLIPYGQVKMMLNTNVQATTPHSAAAGTQPQDPHSQTAHAGRFSHTPTTSPLMNKMSVGMGPPPVGMSASPVGMSASPVGMYPSLSEEGQEQDRLRELEQAHDRVMNSGGLRSAFKDEDDVTKLKRKIYLNDMHMKEMEAEGWEMDDMSSEALLDYRARNVLIRNRIEEIERGQELGKRVLRAPSVPPQRAQLGIPLKTQHLFIDHAKYEGWDKVMAMVELNPNIINVQPSGRASALYQAVYANNLEMVKYLLNAGADKNATFNGEVLTSIKPGKGESIAPEILALL